MRSLFRTAFQDSMAKGAQKKNAKSSHGCDGNYGYVWWRKDRQQRETNHLSNDDGGGAYGLKIYDDIRKHGQPL